MDMILHHAEATDAFYKIMSDFTEQITERLPTDDVLYKKAHRASTRIIDYLENDMRDHNIERVICDLKWIVFCTTRFVSKSVILNEDRLNHVLHDQVVATLQAAIVQSDRNENVLRLLMGLLKR